MLFILTWLNKCAFSFLQELKSKQKIIQMFIIPCVLQLYWLLQKFKLMWRKYKKTLWIKFKALWRNAAKIFLLHSYVVNY